MLYGLHHGKVDHVHDWHLISGLFGLELHTCGAECLQHACCIVAERWKLVSCAFGKLWGTWQACVDLGGPKSQQCLMKGRFH